MMPAYSAPASRAERRAASKPPTASELAAAEKAGYCAHGRGVDYRKPGACPYTDQERIDAWARGYSASCRKRAARKAS